MKGFYQQIALVAIFIGTVTFAQAQCMPSPEEKLGMLETQTAVLKGVAAGVEEMSAVGNGGADKKDAWMKAARHALGKLDEAKPINTALGKTEEYCTAAQLFVDSLAAHPEHLSDGTTTVELYEAYQNIQRIAGTLGVAPKEQFASKMTLLGQQAILDSKTAHESCKVTAMNDAKATIKCIRTHFRNLQILEEAGLALPENWVDELETELQTARASVENPDQGAHEVNRNQERFNSQMYRARESFNKGEVDKATEQVQYAYAVFAEKIGVDTSPWDAFRFEVITAYREKYFAFITNNMPRLLNPPSTYADVMIYQEVTDAFSQACWADNVLGGNDPRCNYVKPEERE